MRCRVKYKTLIHARKMRSAPTAFEKALWRELRKLNRQGYHFRRQAPFRGYILDFVEHGNRVVVELDGAHHLDPRQTEHDLKRDRVLEKEGYLVLRFQNGEVVETADSVAQAIVRELAKRKPQPPTRTASQSDLPTRGRYIWERRA